MPFARIRLLLVGLLPACANPCGGAAPPEFARLQQDLSGPKTVTMTVSWPDPELPVTHDLQVKLRPEEARVSGRPGAISTDGSMVVLEAEMKVPLVDLADEGAELFDELRSGLAHAHWAPIEAPRVGALRPAADAAWAELTLPFDWMDGETVLLAVDRETGALRYVVIETETPPLQVSARPPRGGARTVTLSDGGQLGLAVHDYTTR